MIKLKALNIFLHSASNLNGILLSVYKPYREVTSNLVSISILKNSHLIKEIKFRCLETLTTRES